MSILTKLDDHSWGEEQECVECGLAKELDVGIPWDIWVRCIYMSSTLKHEWLGYFTGTIDGDRIVVGGLEIPLQEVSAASVEVLDDGGISNIVGVIHSHPFMKGKPSFSGTDRNYANQNHEFSIVMSASGEFDAVGRVETQCGRLATAKVTTHLIGEQIDMSQFRQRVWAVSNKADAMVGVNGVLDDTRAIGAVRQYMCGDTKVYQLYPVVSFFEQLHSRNNAVSIPALRDVEETLKQLVDDPAGIEPSTPLGLYLSKWIDTIFDEWETEGVIEPAP